MKKDINLLKVLRLHKVCMRLKFNKLIKKRGRVKLNKYILYFNKCAWKDKEKIKKS